MKKGPYSDPALLMRVIEPTFEEKTETLCSCFSSWKLSTRANFHHNFTTQTEDTIQGKS